MRYEKYIKKYLKCSNKVAAAVSRRFGKRPQSELMEYLKEIKEDDNDTRGRSEENMKFNF